MGDARICNGAARRDSGQPPLRAGLGISGRAPVRRSANATAIIRFARQGNANKVWAAKLLECKSARLVSVALVNKTARIAWVVLARNQSYVAPAT
jgi:transposase